MTSTPPSRIIPGLHTTSAPKVWFVFLSSGICMLYNKLQYMVLQVMPNTNLGVWTKSKTCILSIILFENDHFWFILFVAVWHFVLQCYRVANLQLKEVLHCLTVLKEK